MHDKNPKWQGPRPLPIEVSTRQGPWPLPNGSDRRQGSKPLPTKQVEVRVQGDRRRCRQIDPRERGERSGYLREMARLPATACRRGARWKEPWIDCDAAQARKEMRGAERHGGNHRRRAIVRDLQQNGGRQCCWRTQLRERKGTGDREGFLRRVSPEAAGLEWLSALASTGGADWDAPQRGREVDGDREVSVGVAGEAVARREQEGGVGASIFPLPRCS
jgi:hypothetical protein